MERPDIRDAVLHQLRVPRTPSALRASPAAATLRLETLVARNHFLGVDLLAPDGTDIASTSEGALGTRALARLDPHPFASALAGAVAVGLPFQQPEGFGDGRPAATLAAPVRDDAGDVVAVLAFRLDPERGLTEMTQLGRIGETGETYAFDREGRLITESRFDQHLRDIGLIGSGERGILNVALRDPGGNLMDGYQPPLPRSEQPLTRMARAAVAGHSGVDMNGYRDYRGVPVVGAWTWDNDLGFGLATEMNRNEAYAIFGATRAVALSLVGAVLLGTACLVLLLRALAKRLSASVYREETTRSSLEVQFLRAQQAEADLDAAVHARDEFLRNASHELRTPITSLGLLYQRLIRSARSEATLELPPDQVERFVRTSERQFSRLNQLIDNMLDVAREAKGKVALNLEEVDLAELVRQSAQRVQDHFVAARSRLDLELEGPLIGCWDRFRIAQVVCNLLTNAARFGLGHPVRVELRRGPGVACLSVEDHGIGIPQQELGRIFDRFNHAGPLRDASGLGVGLYVARAIVEAHGGTIRAESSVGKGSTFLVDLPISPVPLEDAAPSPCDGGGIASPLIPRAKGARA